MKRTFKQLIIIPLALLSLAFVVTSCNKKEAAKAEITVVLLDSDGEEERVTGATVNVICTPITKPTCASGIEQEGETNSSGKVEFEWPHSAIYGSDDVGFAVLKVEAYGGGIDSTYCYTNILPSGFDTVICQDSTYVKYGSVFIELQIDKVAKETITIIAGS
jgi:hypothetical protein